MYDPQPLPCAPNSNGIAQAVANTDRSLGINSNSFYLIFFDAAKFVMALGTGTILNFLYHKLFHEACVAHLLHNCAMKVKSHLEDIHQLVAKIESATSRNKPDSLQLVAHDTPF